VDRTVLTAETPRDDSRTVIEGPVETARPGLLARSLAYVQAHPVQVSLFGGYLTALVLVIRRGGVFYDRERLGLWLGAAMLILVAGRGSASVVRVLRDWSLFVFLFVGYDLTRGAADNLWNGHYHITEPITVEKLLFWGEVPTVWLQDRLFDATHVPWWEAIVGVTYMTHFFVVYVITAVLYVRSRDRWARWTISLVTTTVLGLIGFALYPMAPPWMAAQRHDELPPVERIGTRGLTVLELDFAQRLWQHGSKMVNTVAAMPSLHAGYSMLVTAFFLPRVRSTWVRALLIAYPLVMMFTLAYGGEHYVIDVLAGWAIALVGIWFGGWARDRWLERHAAVP
jgi:membrane-associated phospholipid phosphatase